MVQPQYMRYRRQTDGQKTDDTIIVPKQSLDSTVNQKWPEIVILFLATAWTCL